MWEDGKLLCILLDYEPRNFAGVTTVSKRNKNGKINLMEYDFATKETFGSFEIGTEQEKVGTLISFPSPR